MKTAKPKRVRAVTVKCDANLKKRYTRAVKYGRGNWSAFLAVDGQSFCIASNTNEQRARWFRRMLGIALTNLVKAERAGITAGRVGK